ncbi:ABC transporter permease [Hathewaya histolytica]|uniref:ABC-type multidrug transport system, permease component n=1 Tax=Hathewaya histolytica TaxID=1498 RepID=A0A4U9R4R1_HATHI|nr:ABC transporter permease [Hathewaya histolytica]VTQ86046.1 ABC-type multidrug transport system, permease component [Hathewaya histolytica]
MKELLTLIIYNFKRIFRNKGNIVSYFIVPIVISVLLINVLSGSSGNKISIYIENKDKGIFSRDLIERLKTEGNFQIKESKINNVKEEIMKEKIDVALIIPENFTDSMYIGNPKKVELITLKGEEVTHFISGAINIYINNLKDIYKYSKGNREEFNSIYKSYSAEGIKVEEVKIKDLSRNKGATTFALGFFIMFMILFASSISRLILKDNLSGMSKRICITKIDEKKYILGNVITNLLILMVQSLAVVLILERLIKISTFIPLKYIILILWTFSLCAVALSMLIISFSRSMNGASILTSLIITPTSMLSGSFWPREIMPKFILDISNFIPQTWAIDAFSRASKGEGIEKFYINILIILGFSAMFFIFATFKSKSHEKYI